MLVTCPVCAGDTKVNDSRKYNDYVRRSRKCLECGYTFTTIETDEDIYQRLEKGKNNVRDDD